MKLIHQILSELNRLWLQLWNTGPWLTLLTGLDKLGRFITGRPVWRFSRVTPNLILSGQPATRAWPYLYSRGVTGVINMRSEYDYDVKIEGGAVDYLNLPTVDRQAPSLEHLAEGVGFIRQQVERGGKVYIHCWEGLGRGPTMAAAYLVSNGMTSDEAWDHIRRVRPFIAPLPVQKEQLERFASFYQQAHPVEAKEEILETEKQPEDIPDNPKGT